MRLLHMMKILKKEGLFMKDVRSTVMQLSGRWGNTCYNMLCLAVEAAKGFAARGIPDEKDLERGPGGDRKKPGDNLPRPDPRGDGHLGAWEPGTAHGNFCPDADESADSQGACVYAGGICEAVAGLSVLLGPRSGQYGLLVRLDCEPVAMTAPFSANRADVEKLAAQLTVQQRPLAEFRLQFLSGEIPGVLPEQTGEWTKQDDET